MRDTIARFIRDESGTTAIEYALIASFIALLLVPAATTIGTNLSGTFDNVAGAVK
jgi:pilus assembly protein Flp/PilA